jgi:hypothetical protein
MSSRFWRWYADRQFHKWEKTVLWDMVEPYRPPRSFAPLVGTYVAAFYTGVVGAAVTEQLYKVCQPQRLDPPCPCSSPAGHRYCSACQVLVGMLARETAPAAADLPLACLAHRDPDPCVIDQNFQPLRMISRHSVPEFICSLHLQSFCSVVIHWKTSNLFGAFQEFGLCFCQERRTLDSPGLGYVTRSLRPSSPVGVFLLTAGLRERGRR